MNPLFRRQPAVFRGWAARGPAPSSAPARRAGPLTDPARPDGLPPAGPGGPVLRPGPAARPLRLGSGHPRLQQQQQAHGGPGSLTSGILVLVVVGTSNGPAGAS
jgi:hypothetical protein